MSDDVHLEGYFDVWGHQTSILVAEYRKEIAEHALRLGCPAGLLDSLINLSLFYLEGLAACQWDVFKAATHLGKVHAQLNELNQDHVVYDSHQFTTYALRFQDRVDRDSFDRHTKNFMPYIEAYNEECQQGPRRPINLVEECALYRPQSDIAELCVAAHTLLAINFKEEGFWNRKLDQRHERSYQFFDKAAKDFDNRDDAEAQKSVDYMARRIKARKGNIPKLSSLIQWGQSRTKFDDGNSKFDSSSCVYVRPFLSVTPDMKFPSGQADFVTAHYMLNATKDRGRLIDLKQRALNARSQ